MSEVDIKKALKLLKEAHELLKGSEIENLQRSADYLVESIEWLKRQKPGKSDNIR